MASGGHVAGSSSDLHSRLLRSTSVNELLEMRETFRDQLQRLIDETNSLLESRLLSGPDLNDRLNFVLDLHLKYCEVYEFLIDRLSPEHLPILMAEHATVSNAINAVYRRLMNAAFSSPVSLHSEHHSILKNQDTVLPIETPRRRGLVSDSFLDSGLQGAHLGLVGNQGRCVLSSEVQQHESSHHSTTPNHLERTFIVSQAESSFSPVISGNPSITTIAGSSSVCDLSASSTFLAHEQQPQLRRGFNPFLDMIEESASTTSANLQSSLVGGCVSSSFVGSSHASSHADFESNQHPVVSDFGRPVVSSTSQVSPVSYPVTTQKGHASFLPHGSQRFSSVVQEVGNSSFAPFTQLPGGHHNAVNVGLTVPPASTTAFPTSSNFFDPSVTSVPVSQQQGRVFQDAYSDPQAFLPESSRFGGIQPHTSSSRVISTSFDQGPYLERLKVPTFSGKKLEFWDFWNRFKLAVHDKSNLSKATKLQYLLEHTSDTAKAPLRNLPINDEAYDYAISILHRRYGRRTPCINAHVHQLLSMPIIPEKSEPKILRSTADKMESHIRALQALNVNLHGDVSAVLAPILFSRLPSDIQLTWTEFYREEEMTVFNVLEFLQRQVENRERSFEISSLYAPHKKEPASRSPQSRRRHQPPHPRGTMSLVNESRLPPCCFCQADHHPNTCFKKQNFNPKEAHDLVVKSGRCIRCLGPHVLKNCRGDKKCKKCNGNHHPSLCFKSFSPKKSSDSTSRSEVTGSSSQSDHGGDSGKAFHAFHSDGRRKTLFQSATVWVRSSQHSGPVRARLIFDSGSDFSYITSTLVSKLECEEIGEDSSRLQGFGGVEHPIRKRKRFRIFLSSTSNPSRLFEISALETKSICTGIDAPSKLDVETFSHLKNLSLADPPGGTLGSQINILIGLDFFAALIGSKVIKGLAHEPVAQESVFGYLLCGRSFSTSNTPSSKKSKSYLLVSESKGDALSEELKSFWTIENIGIDSSDNLSTSEHPVFKDLKNSVTFKNGRYEVRLRKN